MATATTPRPAPVTGFCLCQKPNGQPRLNVLVDDADLNNSARRCATCKSTYSAAILAVVA